MKKITAFFVAVLYVGALIACSNITTSQTIQTTTNPPTTSAPPTSGVPTIAPTTISPSTLAPTTVAPTTVAPTTVAPTTVVPTTMVPTTGIPTTLAPTTQLQTLLPLEVPTDLAIQNNIIQFHGVQNATKYQLQVRAVSSGDVSYYFVPSGFNLRLILTDGTYGFSLRAIGNQVYGNSAYSSEVVAEIMDPNRTNNLSGSDLEDYRYMNWTGRTYYDETQEIVSFYYTASGFEVGFYGTSLQATFVASNTSTVSKRPHLVIFIDGTEHPNAGTTIVLDQAEKTVTLASGLEEGYHRVKVLKRSEAIDSNTALKNISTDGYFAEPAPDKALKFQFIAASSSTGFGNLAASSSEAKSTQNSNGLLGFAYLASYMMNAECAIVAASGWGVSRGYNTPGGAISTVENIPNAYDYVAINASNRVLTELGRWDHTQDSPDVIVVNLGSNDFNASGYSSMSDEDKALLRDRFVQDYSFFLEKLHNYHPNAVIIVAYGLMGESMTLEPVTLQVVQNLNEITDCVHAFKMESAGAYYPYGSSSHPTVGTHVNVANALVDYIVELTDFTIQRPRVTYP